MQARLDGGEVTGGVHVALSGGVVKHCHEVLAAAPLGVVDDAGAVETGVDVGGDEPWLVAHDLLRCLDEQVDELLLGLWGNG